MNWKAILVGAGLVLALITVVLVVQRSPRENRIAPTSDSSPVHPLEFSETVVLKAESQLVRHILLRGTNEQIGRKLADIARERYGLQPAANPDVAFGTARVQYFQRNYPIHYERMKGVAASYGRSVHEYDVDMTILPYNVNVPPACSAVFYPASSSATGRSFVVRNMDFGFVTVSELLGLQPAPGEKAIFAEPYIVEVYPDEGYNSLYLSIGDLLAGTTGGINSEGLAVLWLVDHEVQANDVRAAGDQIIGNNQYQMARQLLDTCATVEEAKEGILRGKIYDIGKGAHYLIADRYGNSFIYERNPKDLRSHISDNGGQPQIMTNHPIWEYMDVSEFPTHFEDPYDSMNRYRILYNTLRDHQGKYDVDFAVKANEMVFPRGTNATLGGPSMTLRPNWQVVLDLDERSMQVRFYLHDGKTTADGVDSVMSDFSTFRLQPDGGW